jgi:outer membrane lipoprotein-sorting protein
MRISKRWIPSIAVPAVIALGAVAVPLQANAVDLPDLSAAEVMVLMQKGEVLEFSGTIVKVSDMGLPSLEFSSMVSEDMADQMAEKMPAEFADFVPAVIESNTLTQAMEFVSGTHTVRVYVSGKDKLRAQILDPMSQRDLIVNGDEFWAYDAKTATATTGTINMEIDPAKKATAEQEIQAYAESIALDLSSPEAIANYLVDMIDETSTVEVGRDHNVAGRSAYQLIISPDAAGSLVDRAEISVDSETGLPLKVEIFSTQQSAAAMSVGFESISFGPIDSSIFEFTPPTGTEVTTLDSSDLEGYADKDTAALEAELKASLADSAKPEVIGDNWQSVVHLPVMPADIPAGLMATELFGDMLTEVPGGKVFSTALVNVLLTDSGEVYMGAVTVEYLLSVAK